MAATLTATAAAAPDGSIDVVLDGASDVVTNYPQVSYSKNLLPDEWSNASGSSTTVTRNASGGYAPFSTSWTIAFPAGSNGAQTQAFRHLDASGESGYRTASVWVKGSGSVYLQVRDTAGGVITTSATKALGASWFQLAVTWYSPADKSAQLLLISSGGAANATASAAQVEIGGTATGPAVPIPWGVGASTTPPMLIPAPSLAPADQGMDVFTIGSASSDVVLTMTATGLTAGKAYRALVTVRHIDGNTERITLKGPSGATDATQGPWLDINQTLAVTWTATGPTATLSLTAHCWWQSAATRWRIISSTIQETLTTPNARAIERTDKNGVVYFPIPIGANRVTLTDTEAAISTGPITYRVWAAGGWVEAYVYRSARTTLGPRIGRYAARAILNYDETRSINGAVTETTGALAWTTRGLQPGTGTVTLLVDTEARAVQIMNDLANAKGTVLIRTPDPDSIDEPVVILSVTRSEDRLTVNGWTWLVRVTYRKVT